MAALPYDVVILGAGPAGLSAALTLGRGRKRVLICDTSPPRNVAAKAIHGFVTRDGTPPAEFRSIGRAQLATYPSVEIRDARAQSIHGERGAFTVQFEDTSATARRVILCTGMIDEPPELDGLSAVWGQSSFQCPYCHGWEIQDRRFGYLATRPELLGFPLLLRGWSRDVTVFTSGRIEIAGEARANLIAAGVRIEERPIARLASRDGQLERVELVGGDALPCDALFVHPPQRHTALVTALGLALDAAGFVQIDEHRQTSIPGIYAAGDLATPMQSALIAAAAGGAAAAMLNHELTVELAIAGALG